MGRSENTMPGAINSCALFLSMGAPQHKDDRGLSPIDRRYHCVSKALPTLTLMRSRDAVLN